MRLSDLQIGNKAVVVKVAGRGAFRKRIIEMGFIKGKVVEALQNAPLQDPIKYKIMDYEVSLRRSEAQLIEVISVDEEDLDIIKPEEELVIISTDDLIEIAAKQSKTINVAFVGNPNSGKTTLFNYASGSHERVGNYSGVTVNAKEGILKHNGYIFKIVDLPGTYSLSAYSPEELYVRKYIEEGRPDIIVNIVAASNLERNLYLTTQIIDMDYPLVIALNMYDELEKSGNKFDYEFLAKMIGSPIVPTVGKTGEGVNKLLDTLIQVYEGKNPLVRHIHINYGEVLEDAIGKIQKSVLDKFDIPKNISSRYLSIKLLERDKEKEKYITDFPKGHKLLEYRDYVEKKLTDLLKEDCDSALTNARYGFIDGALLETYSANNSKPSNINQKIDQYVTGKIWGFPIFFLFMYIMFQCTFTFGKYPQEGIEYLIEQLGGFVHSIMPEGSLKDLIINGIIGGVGGVIVFLPNIVILYCFISLMEDSGYMARAAFIMDKVMHKIGLHGKSFIPLIMGFGCNVPAVMATRTIEDRNSRLITMLINPFMSCSARLPVYLLFAGAFFPSHAGFVLFGLYFTGILFAIIMSRIFKRYLVKGEDIPFVMELPPYRVPTVKSMLIHMWEKSVQYLKKMGNIILFASIIIWFLSYYPKQEDPVRQEENSYIGHVGKFIEPVMSPLGYDWKISVSLLSGAAAKEVVVSTLGVLYNEKDTEGNGLSDRLKAEIKPDGTHAFTPLISLSLMLFVLIYFPCIATIAAIKNESGSWKWALFTIFYTTGLAWISSFSLYQIGKLLGFQ